MIRFNCPKCGRSYELPNVMAHLSLVCKRCGEPLVVPEPGPDSEPAAESGNVAPRTGEPRKIIGVPVPAPPVPPPPPSRDKPVEVPPVKEPEVVLARPEPVPETHLEIVSTPVPGSPGEAAISTLPARKPTEPEPAPAQSWSEPERERKPLPILVDVLVGLLLLAIGIFLGEMLTKRSTGDVLREASSAAKFPPIDLLLWLAPSVIFGLGYGLLVSREKSLGAWLRRRGTG